LFKKSTRIGLNPIINQINTPHSLSLAQEIFLQRKNFASKVPIEKKRFGPESLSQFRQSQKDQKQSIIK